MGRQFCNKIGFKECDIIIDSKDGWRSKQLDIKANQGCKKGRVGRIVRPLEAGYSIRDSARLCSFLLRDVLSLHLLEMKIDKTFETIWNNHRKQTMMLMTTMRSAYHSQILVGFSLFILLRWQLASCMLFSRGISLKRDDGVRYQEVH